MSGIPSELMEKACALVIFGPLAAARIEVTKANDKAAARRVGFFVSGGG